MCKEETWMTDPIEVPPFKLIAAIGGLPFVALCLVLGARLLILARKTRALPELAMGGALFLMGGLGYPLTSIARMAVGQPVERRTAFMIAAHLCMITGISLMGLFNWRVFRPTSRGARAAAIALAVAALACFVAQGLSPGYAAGAVRKEGTPIVILNVLSALVMLWSSVESFGYWRKLRRRVALGLAEPLVVDRFRLWGLAAASATTISLSATGLHALGLDPAASLQGALVVGTLGPVAATSMGLAFLPPAFWRRRVERRHAADGAT